MLDCYVAVQGTSLLINIKPQYIPGAHPDHPWNGSLLIMTLLCVTCPYHRASFLMTRNTKELDHEKLVTVILVPLSERHGE
jgi:hypothetical protein